MNTDYEKTESYNSIKDNKLYEDIFNSDEIEMHSQRDEKSERQSELERRFRIEQAHLKRVQKKELYQLRLTLAFIGVGVFALLSGYWVAKVKSEVQLTKEMTETYDDTTVTQEVSSIIYQDWKLQIVNAENGLQFPYTPTLTVLTNGVQVDERIEEELLRMVKAGKTEAGVDILVVSGYISRLTQLERFNDSIATELENGNEYYTAYNKVIKSTQLPGFNERELGLTVTLVGRDYQSLDEKQSSTATAVWLNENCARFGFILRYPDGKQSITGQSYQSWCFRYVGQNVASIIMNDGKSLEEYLNTK